jgi:hypothetical protein
MAWELFFPHRYEPTHSTAAAVARITSLPAPPEAKNIRTAEYHHFQAFAEYVRFEAPVDVCLRYAESIAGEKLKPVDAGDLQMYQQRFLIGGFRDLKWFDLSTAVDVVGAGGGPSVPEVWVDRKRGVFYYCKTD